ncbi:hypothetical protein CRUP_030198 [Coryphaenoides rupestris]|nr:hypothetical protein CRUP_030198 [Coryphaenoides rupestris]
METMAAASAGSATCLPATGLDISLAALRRQDPYINNIVDVASQVALYTFNNRTNEWEKTEVEGTLFVYTRLASPRHGFTIMNRLSMENLTEPITKELDFQLQDPFLLYRNARLVIHGIWFYDKQDCQRIAQRMKALTQQEQALAQSQGGLLRSPGGGVGTGGAGGGVGGGGGVEGQGVDILQMLANARTEYDKDSGEAGEPRSLSLATLFGSQAPHPSPSNPALLLSPGGPALGPKPATGPPTMTATGSSRKPGQPTGGRSGVAPSRVVTIDPRGGANATGRAP